MHPLVLAGLAIEVVGIAIAGTGFYRTFAPRRRLANDCGPTPLPRFGDRDQPRLCAEALLRRIIRRPKKVTIALAGSAQGGAFTADARIVTTFPPFRRLWDHEERLLELAARTAELRRKIEDEEFTRHAGGSGRVRRDRRDCALGVAR